ncbi:AzlD family protein [Pseudomonas indica]|uniref:AzlD family protein n=1 Tax=Pseudomonas indica TaxID=137658 RepID=UPI000BABDDDF|nr:AzlD family protein [Pseudomonas indica]MBU3056534.1 AzlD family protein [Pseudomonas indica]PAU60841.1 hypothetical protein BZL42_09720 [Pseudomonas indica]
MMDNRILLTIALMATVTYLTRVLGFVLLRNRTFSPAMQSVMEAAPGCVLIAVIAPTFVSGQPADLLALAVTLFAAIRFSILPVVLIAIFATGGLRYLLPT